MVGLDWALESRVSGRSGKLQLLVAVEPGWRWESVGMMESVCLTSIQRCRQQAALGRLVSKDKGLGTMQGPRARLEQGQWLGGGGDD